MGQRIDLRWFKEQVQAYSRRVQLYRDYASDLERTLDRVAKSICSSPLVQVRAKSVPSFAGKVAKKAADWEGQDVTPLMTDLCGARVIVHLLSEVRILCAFLREHFVVDESASQDVSERLAVDQFGYRSIHLILKPRRLPSGALDLGLARRFGDLIAEVQVRTIAQHAWPEVVHDRIYKSAFTVPSSFQRDAARLAALLEEADRSFSEMAQEIDTLATNVDSLMDHETARDEIERLQAVLPYCKGDPGVLYRLGRLLCSQGRWEEVISLLKRKGLAAGRPELRLLLGRAYCETDHERPNSDRFKRGRELLASVASEQPGNVEAQSLLADAYGSHSAPRYEQLKASFCADPTDPRALARYLVDEIRRSSSLEVLSLVRHELELAIAKNQLQVDSGVGLPWTQIYLSIFELLMLAPLGYPRGKSDSVHAYRSLGALLDGIVSCPSTYLATLIRETQEMFASLKTHIPESRWGQAVLDLVKWVRLQPIRKSKSLAPSGPVVIVAGGCDPAYESHMRTYRDLLRGAFERFEGRVISAGTIQGIGGIVGEIAARSKGRIRAIGYIPSHLPHDAQRDQRYAELRISKGGPGFSAVEPLEAWADLLKEGIAPDQVCLLGVNGGMIAALEYRLAAVLGASVGVVAGSGRAADQVFQDRPIMMSRGVAVLPTDPDTLAAFLNRPQTRATNAKTREAIGRAIHERYRQSKLRKPQSLDPALVDWEELQPPLRSSNLEQGDDIQRKLVALGLALVPLSRGNRARHFRFTRAQVEKLARMEHGRWNVERALDGWRLGERDHAAKTSPYLTAWDCLPDDVKMYDVDAVTAIPEILAQAGYGIRKDRS